MIELHKCSVAVARPVEEIESILSRGAHTWIKYRTGVGTHGSIHSELVDEDLDTVLDLIAAERRKKEAHSFV